MIQQLTSPSNYSVNQDALHLNGSSMVSPSESNFDSGLKDHLIDFEQFRQQSRPNLQSGQCGKKKLTIRIDQSYQCNENTQHNDKLAKAFQKSNQKCLESLTSPMSNFNLISPIDSNQASMTKYYELARDMQTMQEKLQHQQKIIEQLTIRIQDKQDKIYIISSQNIQMKEQIKLRDVELLKKATKVNQLEQIIKRYEDNFLETNEKKREKDVKMKQMIRLSQKLKSINRDLTMQAKINEKKVRDLEKQIQRTMCLTSQENINKLKQSSLKLKETQRSSQHNKQNSIINGQRKSLERKKGVMSMSHLQNGKKPAKMLASSSTILTKKLMQK